MNISYTNRPNLVQEYDQEVLEREAQREEFISASVYVPGRIVTMSDRKYRVGKAGNLIRINNQPNPEGE